METLAGDYAALFRGGKVMTELITILIYFHVAIVAATIARTTQELLLYNVWVTFF